jgi:hypothetical protein
VSGGGIRWLWVAPLAFAVHALGANPAQIGIWGDDAIYLALARALDAGTGPIVDILPGAPAAFKYPWGFPALLHLLRLGGASDLGVLLVQAALWALAAQLVVSSLLPRLGASGRVRVATGLLLAVNGVTWRLVPQVMSEPAFALALVGACAVVVRRDPPVRELVALAALVFVGSALRGVGSLYALAGIAAALLSRRAPVAAALGAGWLLASLVSQAQRAGAPHTDGEGLDLLAYYVSYDSHVAWYREQWLSGGPAALVGAATRVMGANLALAPLSLGQFVWPGAFVTDGSGGHAGTTALGGLVLGLVALGSGHRARALGVLVVAHVGVFLLWTWPFSTRFWLPIWPVLVPLALLGLESIPGRVARLAWWPVIGAVLVGNAIGPFYAAAALRSPPVATAPADAAFDRTVAVLRQRFAPGDVVVGESWVFWLVAPARAQGIEARMLVPFSDVLADLLHFPPAPGDSERRSASFRTRLGSLRALTPPEHEVWLVIDPQRADTKRSWVQDAERAGAIERVAELETAWVWRAASPLPRPL